MAPTVVLIPGNMCDRRLWSGAGDRLREGLAQRDLAAVDADTARDASVAAMAARALRETDGPLVVTGFSMGAIVALEMTRQAPERIAGLALFGLNAGADLPERAAARPLQQAEVRAGGLEDVILHKLMPLYLAQANAGDAALQALILDMGLTLGVDVFVAQSEALRLRSDLRPVLDGLVVPVLLGCGEDDRLCPPAWHRDWQERATGSRCHIFAGAGHMLTLEQPEAFAEILLGWIDEQGWTE